jgi:soluble lytic murein transglycosylase-like protein
VAYVSVGFLALTAVVAGTAVALTQTDSDRAAAGPVVTTTSAPAPIRTAPLTPNSPAHHATRPAAQSTPQPTATASNAAVTVPPLRKLTPPDAIVTLPRAATTHSLTWLRKQAGFHRIAVADRGSVRIHGTRLRTIGVPLSSIRGFTPSLTASSNALWRSIARGELTVAYANAKPLRHHLGQTYSATGRHATSAPLRVGAFATIGLDGAQALLSHRAAAGFGLAPRRVVLVTAPKVSLDTLTADLHKAFGTKAKLDITRAMPVDQSQASAYATSTIPALYLELYRRAAVTCPGLPWTVLAGIGTVETGNGRNVHRSTAGAEGPMQFMPSTWAMYGYDADGNGMAEILTPTDSVFSAARYLCAAGAGRGGQSLNNAIFAYNHAWWYVREVVQFANEYA